MKKENRVLHHKAQGRLKPILGHVVRALQELVYVVHNPLSDMLNLAGAVMVYRTDSGSPRTAC